MEENVMTQAMIVRLQQAGYRKTAARNAVMAVLRQAPLHLTHQEILSQARALNATLSLASVYRTLELFTSLGLCRPLYLGEGGPRFACVEDGHHHHMVCRACYCTYHFPECTAGELEVELSSRFGFRIESHLVEFYGLCRECQAEGEAGKDGLG
ncbi:MAG: transcriptional repressor [Coprothermobacterota bacterium]|nr:transcriptional repressor [Coprothermobacterota bacterium]